jgi:hypothetical protein
MYYNAGVAVVNSYVHKTKSGYDFLNVFAKKFSEKIGVCDSKQS